MLDCLGVTDGVHVMKEVRLNQRFLTFFYLSTPSPIRKWMNFSVLPKWNQINIFANLFVCFVVNYIRILRNFDMITFCPIFSFIVLKNVDAFDVNLVHVSGILRQFLCRVMQETSWCCQNNFYWGGGVREANWQPLHWRTANLSETRTSLQTNVLRIIPES